MLPPPHKRTTNKCKHPQNGQGGLPPGGLPPRGPKPASTRPASRRPASTRPASTRPASTKPASRRPLQETRLHEACLQEACLHEACLQEARQQDDRTRAPAQATTTGRKHPPKGRQLGAGTRQKPRLLDTGANHNDQEAPGGPKKP